MVRAIRSSQRSRCSQCKAICNSAAVRIVYRYAYSGWRTVKRYCRACAQMISDFIAVAELYETTLPHDPMMGRTPSGGTGVKGRRPLRGARSAPLTPVSARASSLI